RLIQGLYGFSVNGLTCQYHLETIIVRRIMTTRHHDARLRIQHMSTEIEYRRGNHAKIDDVDTNGLQPFRQCLCQLRSGQTAVTADHDCFFAFGAHCATECATDIACNPGIQCLADNAAYVIRLENSLSECCHV